MLYSGMHPVIELVTEFQMRYGHLALFLYNALACEAIAVVWRPTCESAVPFNALHSRCCSDKESSATTINTTGDCKSGLNADRSATKQSAVVLGKGSAMAASRQQLLQEMRLLAGDIVIAVLD